MLTACAIDSPNAPSNNNGMVVAPITNSNSSTTTPSSAAYNFGVDITGVTNNDNPAQITINGNLWDDMQDNLQLPDASDQPRVQEQILWFQRHRGYLNKIIKQSAPYIYYIYQQTKIRNLPAELALVPIIESEYYPFAHSKVGAIGLWQMMPGTASGFGLKINWWYDGRRDLIASTKAALDYLAYLHDFFTNDWLLAIAAYDSGEGTVQKAVAYNKRHKRSTSFWSLHLPKETLVYVPKILALSAIIRDPYRYNINLMPINDAPYLEQIDVGSQIDLDQAAKLAGMKTKTLRFLNPGYRRWATDPDGPYTLLVPANKAAGFRQRLDALPNDQRVTWRVHYVTAGETLGVIAHKYRINMTILKKVNHLKTNIIRLKQKLYIPEHFHGKLKSTIIKQKSTIAEESLPGPQRVVHLVCNGDTLWTIADKYGVKVRELCFWNHLTSKTALTKNQKILIWAPPHKYTLRTHIFYHKVKSGDSLFVIARHFNSTAKEIRRANHLRNNTIHVGQKLKIPHYEHIINHYYHVYHHNHRSTYHHSLLHTYKVQPGDSLSGIAHRYKTSVQNIKHLNKLKNNTLNLGQTLKIQRNTLHKQKKYKHTQKIKHKSTRHKNIQHSKAKQPNKNNSKYLYHTVRKGDTFQSIAKEFKVSVAKIKAWNNLQARKYLPLGRKIYIYFPKS